MTPQTLSSRPIGVFDSGVGGLSVLRAMHEQMPREKLIFLADQGHVPYGPRPIEEVRLFSEEITRYLLARGAKMIVVACNTASAAALVHLRETFPKVPFVGMEPAVKPAAEQTESGVVGVLATPATFQGQLYASVVERFAKDVEVMQDTCPGLVEQIEAGAMKSAQTRAILEKALNPMLARGIDRVVLGCTHYPFVIGQIQAITGPGVRVIDPAPAVARQAKRVLIANVVAAREKQVDDAPQQADVRYLTTGSVRGFQSLANLLLGELIAAERLQWEEGRLVG